MDEPNPVLNVQGLNAHYGESHILHGMDFKVHEGEVVSLLGRNGAGKTTTLKAIVGLVSKRSGSITLRGNELIGRKSFEIARLGIAYCPEERGIFASLTVKENLTLPPVTSPGGLAAEEVFDLFPILAERRHSQGTKLSGGEQQMLAIGRMLVSGARLLLIDEPTEGLAPVIVAQILTILQRLRDQGYTILLVEQNLRFLSALSDRSYIVEGGRVVDVFDSQRFAADIAKVESYLGI